jgi:hypothetical protein
MRAIITVGLRILIIYIFLLFLNEILKNFYVISDTINHSGGDTFTLFSLLGVCMVVILILVIAWIKAGWLSSVLASDLDDNSLVISSTNLEIFRVAMKIVGLVLLATTIPTIAGLIAYQIVLTQPDPVYSTVKEQATLIRYWVIPVVKILIGIWLVLGFRGTITAISKIWNTARMTNNEDEDNPKNDELNNSTDIDQVIPNNNTEKTNSNNEKPEN